jgi:NodT family efflux transporter outer membrane factor (OMF) lipoprotein
MNRISAQAPGDRSAPGNAHGDQVGYRRRAGLSAWHGKIVALGALLTLGISGCMVGPDYQKPASTMPSGYKGSEALDARKVATPAPALDTWWTGFNDPVLTQIIQRALDQNLDLAASLARVDQARAVSKEAGAKELPEGSFDAQTLKLHQSLNSPLGELGSAFPGYNRNTPLNDIGVGASWEADLFGGLKRGAQAADAEAQAAEAEHLGVRITVAAEAADAYFRVRGAQQRIALAQDQVNADAQLVDLVHLRLQGGLATSREVAQAEAVVAQAHGTIPPLRTELETQLNRLDVLMGAQPGTYAAELARTDSTSTVPAISTSQGPADLLRRRPDVLAAERLLAASNAKIGEATSEYYPKLSLSALFGFESLGTGHLINAQSFQPQALAGLHWRLFDFGRVDAEVARAKGANAEALAKYRQSMLRATEDVEDSMVTLVQLEAQSVDLNAEVDAHTRARDAAQDAYKGGLISLIEVLEEDRQLLASRDQLARVHADDLRAAVATFRSLGGGWSAN